MRIGLNCTFIRRHTQRDDGMRLIYARRCTRFGGWPP